MPTIVNTSKEPLRITLPGGKTLHLGVGQRGDISDRALEARSVQKKIEDGLVRIEDGTHARSSHGGGAATHLDTHGTTHAPGVSRSSGDR